MGGCWKDHVLPDSERPPALSRERCADDGRSGRSPSFRVANDARRPSVVAAHARCPARSSDSTISLFFNFAPRIVCDPCGDGFRLTTSIVLPRDGLRISSPQTFDMLASLRTLLTTYPDILRHSTLPACGYCCAIVTGSRAMLLTWCAPQGIERCRVPPNETPIRLWIVVIVVAKEINILL